MTATLTTAFQNHVKGRSHRRCKMLRLDLKDGTVLGFTDHDKPLDYDLDGEGSISYRADYGMTISNIETGTGLDAGNFEATFPIAATSPFTRQKVEGGRFNRAEARLFEVVWNNLAAGERKWVFGNAGEWRVEGDKAICEVRDQRDRLNQTVGESIQNQCTADYADQVECFATPTEITGTVTAADNGLELTVSYSGGPYADSFFNRGTLIGLTGANAGLKAPIWTWNDNGDGTADIVLFFPLVETPPIGDTFTVRDGCSRLARDAVNGCMAHGQILNFRGFPDVPGQKALKPALPSNDQPSGKKG
jgi:uncharacterized phage protein (TIGR02218 family)